MKHLIPQWLVRKIRKKAFHGQFDSYSIFVDISGFTAMTQSLMSGGKEGAEIISSIIDDLFTPAIESIQRYGGFITTFAGDAFTALFPLQPAWYALKTAFAIREHIQSYGQIHTPLGDYPLAVRIGLSFGEVEYRIIEIQKQMAYFFRGKAIDGCALAEHQAQKMQIVADDLFLSRIHLGVEHRFLEERWSEIIRFEPPSFEEEPSVELDWEEDPSIERAFYPDRLFELKERGEFREVLPCFIQFKEEKDYLKGIEQVILTCLDYGGYFNKIDFGDKGGVILVLFGAPSEREKIFQRAADFCLSLRKIPNFTFRVGLSTGIVFAGFVGSALRCEYTALGVVVNLAARLMIGADWGSIHTSAEVERNLKEQYRTRALGARPFKGFSQPLKVFTLESKQSGYYPLSYTSDFVGRDREVSRLKERIGSICQNSQSPFGGVFTIDADAGVGKSRLVHHMESVIPNIRFFYLSCDEILRKSFNPWTGFLYRYFEQNETQSVEENRLSFEKAYQKLVQATQDLEIRKELIRLESVIGALVQLEWEGSLYAQLDPKGQYENTLYAIKTFFKAQSLLQPIAIIVDDAHWMDSDSLTLLKTLIQNVEPYPMILILLCRPQDDGSKIVLIPGQSIEEGIDRMELRRFDRAMMDQLVQALLNRSEVPVETAEFIWEKSEGNPFFVEQLVLYLTERSLLDTDCRLVSKADTIPSGIRQVIIARIDRLSEKMKETVKTASVLGKEFTIRVLNRLLQERRITQLDQDFDEQMELGYHEQIWETLSEMNYVFKHALIRDAMYDIQLKESLRRLHDLAGAVIEDVYRDKLNEQYEDLAEHFSRAKNREKSILYLEKAGNQAREKFQNDKAISFYRNVRDILDEESEASKFGEILLNEADVLQTIGRNEASFENCARALKIFETTQEPKRVVESLNRQGFLLRLLGKGDQALQTLKKSLTIAQKFQDQYGVSEAYNHLGVVCFDKGEYALALEYHEKRAQLSDRLGDRKAVSLAYRNIGVVYHNQGDHKKALEYYQQAHSHFQKLGDRMSASITLSSIGNLHVNMGDLDQALRCYHECLEVFEEFGFKRGVSMIIGNLGVVSHQMNDYPKAMKYYETMMELCKEQGDLHGKSRTLGNMGVIHQDLGEFHSALEYHEKRMELCKQLGDRRGMFITLSNLGRVYAGLHEHELAISYTDRAIQEGEVLGVRYELSEVLYDKAFLLHTKNEDAKALEINQKALEMAQEAGAKKTVFEATILLHVLQNDAKALLAINQDQRLNREQKAAVDHALWKATADNNFRMKALKEYRTLLDSIPKDLYKRRIQELDA